VQVESLTNNEEVELRSKIEALGLEVTKVPSKSAKHLDEVILTSSWTHFPVIMFTLILTPPSMLFSYCKFKSWIMQLEIARELDKLSEKLDDVDEMISSAMAADPQVQSLLSDTADVWMPVITATAEERRHFTAPIDDDYSEVEGKTSD
jgi:hypothetical protein